MYIAGAAEDMQEKDTKPSNYTQGKKKWHRGHCDFGFHFGGLLLELSVYSAGVV